jgi:hypothetical protein
VIDTNVYLSRWPFRRLRGDDTPELVSMLRRAGVTQAWAGSFDALLHKDIAGVNARLAEECRRHGDGLLIPFGTVNPTLPDWEEDLRRCHEVHRMPGIRLHPNYHGYAPGDLLLEQVLAHAQERKLVVQIVCRMEDVRTQHPLLQVPDVNPAPLANLKAPGLRLMLLNVSKPPAGMSFDIAMIERAGGVANVGTEHACFGSYAPFFILESALFKLRESAVDIAALDANAAKLLPR